MGGVLMSFVDDLRSMPIENRLKNECDRFLSSIKDKCITVQKAYGGDSISVKYNKYDPDDPCDPYLACHSHEDCAKVRDYITTGLKNMGFTKFEISFYYQRGYKRHCVPETFVLQLELDW
jgi:hypothetical protein